MFFDELLHLRRQRRLHVVGVVLDVVVLQDRLKASALLLPALLGTRNCGRQAFWREQRLLSGRQVARLYDLFYRVHNRSPFLLAAFVLLAVVFFWWVWMCDFLLMAAPSRKQTSRSPQRLQMLEVEPVSCLALTGDPAPGLIGKVVRARCLLTLPSELFVSLVLLLPLSALVLLRLDSQAVALLP